MQSSHAQVMQNLPEMKNLNTDRMDRLALGYSVSPPPMSEDVAQLKTYYDMTLSDWEELDKGKLSAHNERLTEGYRRLKEIWNTEYALIQGRFLGSSEDQIKALNLLQRAIEKIKTTMVNALGQGVPLLSQDHMRHLVRRQLPFTQEHQIASIRPSSAPTAPPAPAHRR